jgi:RND family efflux transporter MFP subunit
MPPRALLPLAAFCLAIVTAGCGRNEPASAAIPAVLTRPAASASAGLAIYTGEIRARREADLAFRVGGKLIARLVDSGTAVKAGQPLARLDPSDLALARQAAAAQMAAAESELATVLAERDRYAALLQKRFVSQAAFDVREHALSSARARATQASAQYRISENQSAYGTLAADHDGVVTAVLADAGQVVAAGQPVLRVARPEEKEVAIVIPEGRLAEAKAARQIAVRLWAAPELRLGGEIRELAAAADPATRTYAARIRIIDAPEVVQLGMTAQVIFGTEAGGHLAVPLTAVVDAGNGAQVWIVADGKAEPRPVKVAGYREDGAIIAGNVQAGDAVIIAGQRRLSPGQAVLGQPAPEPAGQR